MAKCPVCRGKGYRLRIDDMRFAMAEIVKCESCDGKGVVEPLTEQEWLQTATTEQLAEWLRGVYWHCHEIDCEHCNYPWRCMEKGDIVEWLKQPHTTIANE